jgi:EAL domain-containing protein (putative c-di-GMP-specific phosphodiesterase class I)
MSQLLNLPIDELKIDKSFVQALGNDRRARAIVSSAIELARALDLTLVAEGIETSANLKILEEIGADIGQGWVIAQPLSSAQLEKFLAAHLCRWCLHFAGRGNRRSVTAAVRRYSAPSARDERGSYGKKER